MVHGSSDSFTREEAYLGYLTLFQELESLYISKLSVDNLKGLSGRGIEPLEICCDGIGGVGPGYGRQGRHAVCLANELEAPEILCFGLRIGGGPDRGLSRSGNLSKAGSGCGSGVCVRVTLEHAHQ